MILIADSGSTKTTWMEVESGNKVVTEGLNPHFTTDEQFLAACATVRQHFSIFNSQFSITFYGAGCGNATQCKRVKMLLQKAFETENVEVETDMLGACRATAGNRPALVGILGTGSNACLLVQAISWAIQARPTMWDVCCSTAILHTTCRAS